MKLTVSEKTHQPSRHISIMNLEGGLLLIKMFLLTVYFLSTPDVTFGSEGEELTEIKINSHHFINRH